MERIRFKHFKQENSYGCGLYSLANTFLDENIITPERLEESKKGNYIAQLDKWLLEDERDVYIAPLFYDAMTKTLPEWLLNMYCDNTEENVLSIPILIDIQYTKDSKTHFIAADLDTTGNLIVADSLRNEPYTGTLRELNNNFYRVYGVWAFVSYENHNYMYRYSNELIESQKKEK